MIVRSRRGASGDISNPTGQRSAAPSRWLACASSWALTLAFTAAWAEPGDPSLYHPVPKVKQRPTGFFRPQSLKAASALIQVVEARNDPEFQVDGAGLTVAVLDTGLNTDHVDFSGDGRIPAKVNFTGDDNGDADKVTDGFGHGSNVAGIVVAHKMHTGVAPGANIVPVKILDNDGGGEPATVEKGLEWVLANHVAHNITVAVLSFADNGNYAEDTNVDPRFEGIRTRIRKLRDQRIPVVVAAGNLYHQFNGIPIGKTATAVGAARQGMTVPAIFRETISVGAVYDADYHKPMAYDDGALARRTGPDWFTPFSQRLHEGEGKACRIDIFAPGAPTDSSGNDGPQGESLDTGTSQAAPFVAGVVLLMQQYHKRKTGKLPCVDDLENWLRSSGVSIVDGDHEDDNVVHTRKTFPRLDALGALKAIRQQPCTH